MTTVVDDPLISSMVISRMLPLHESSRRLRELYPECPRVYGVAVIGDLTRRRWWPLSEVLTTDRLRVMFDAASAETDSRVAVAQQLAATLSHVVIGRVVPLLSLEGRAWDTGAGEPLGARRLRGRDRLGRRRRPNAARAAGGPVLQRPLGTAAPPSRQGSASSRCPARRR